MTRPPGRLNPSPRGGWVLRAAAGMFVVVCLVVATGFIWSRYGRDTDAPLAGDPPKPQTPAIGTPLFGAWPKEQKPELVLVLSGQTYGYLSPCGCSRPQKGGLERRYNLMQSLRDRGWPVVGLDLGDISAPKGIHKQNLLKYRTSMKALATMGYAGVGLGEYDFAGQLFELLAEYTLNNPGKPPIVLAGNLVGVQRDGQGKVVKAFTREEYFPSGGEKSRPMVEAVEVVAAPGQPTLGVVGVVGPEVLAKVEKIDGQFAFLENAEYLPKALAALDAHSPKPELRVLLYAGKLDMAKVIAKQFPQFRVILCQSDDAEPPQFPTAVNGGKTLIVQVGHKGQHVGVVGVFKAGGGYDLKYQLVTLGEEYLTPDDPVQVKNNKVLQLLEEYALEVKHQNLLAKFRERPQQHAAQVQLPDAKLTYVGTDACKACHPNEAKQYATTKHSHAYDALVKVAKRPSNRQFDGECVVCHTVGFEYVGGYENAEKTPHLKNVGCENCHGPGSGHVARPEDKRLLALMSPWKMKPDDKLPGLEVMKRMAATQPIDRGAVKLAGNQAQVVDAVSRMCMKCHDTENDPKFDFYEYMPKVYHSNMKPAAGLPLGAGARPPKE
ncbi:MAG TPA: multiheme c-type cytochrome [Fimbriiglobus sp.]|nr:multiheme c-type cytochrome [Fimbriiglobus sp.]